MNPEGTCPVCGDDWEWCPQSRCAACGEPLVGTVTFGRMHRACTARLLESQKASR